MSDAEVKQPSELKMADRRVFACLVTASVVGQIYDVALNAEEIATLAQ